ncbi:MAG: DUF4301 family protein, partial [Flavobacteriales bacterium]|nr:DUF4301 family protein [Flavobacteriales bacterium]
MLTAKEKQEIIVQGKDMDEVLIQLRKLKNGFPNMEIIAPATLEDGIQNFTDEELIRYTSVYEKTELDVVKFVPASGAASRMFKSLQSGLNQKSETEDIKIFTDSIAQFAFNKFIPEGLSPLEVVEHVLGRDGLNYSKLPKGL